MKIHTHLGPGFENLQPWVNALPENFGNQGISIFKDRNEVKIFQVNGLELNVKAFKIPNFINRIAYVYFRGSKAARSFRNAEQFIRCGASTPVPVGFVECIDSGRLSESYYISMHYNCDFTLRDVLSNMIPDKETILRQWVKFTYFQLHQNGIFHRDYSPGNTLIKRADGQYEFAVVDLNRMRFMPVGFKKGLQNFRQLHADSETIDIIAREYAKLCEGSAEEAHKLLLKFDQKNKNWRKGKERFKELIRGKEQED